MDKKKKIEEEIRTKELIQMEIYRKDGYS